MINNLNYFSAPSKYLSYYRLDSGSTVGSIFELNISRSTVCSTFELNSLYIDLDLVLAVKGLG